jgi:hypothetical protein
MLLLLADIALYFHPWPPRDVANREAVITLVLAVAAAIVGCWARTYFAENSVDSDDGREARYIGRLMASVALAFVTQFLVTLFIATHDSDPVGLTVLAGAMQVSIGAVIAENFVARIRAGRG